MGTIGRATKTRTLKGGAYALLPLVFRSVAFDPAGEEEEKEGFSRVVHLCTSRVVRVAYSHKRWPGIASKSQP